VARKLTEIAVFNGTETLRIPVTVTGSARDERPGVFCAVVDEVLLTNRDYDALAAEVERVVQARAGDLSWERFFIVAKRTLEHHGLSGKSSRVGNCALGSAVTGAELSREVLGAGGVTHRAQRGLVLGRDFEVVHVVTRMERHRGCNRSSGDVWVPMTEARRRQFLVARAADSGLVEAAVRALQTRKSANAELVRELEIEVGVHHEVVGGVPS